MNYKVGIANLHADLPKRDMILKKCWESPSIQKRLKEMNYKWFFDGKNLAWYAKILPHLLQVTC